MEDKDRFVDKLLDSALAHRREAEPRAGLETRIMEGVRAAAGERDARTKVWKLWVAAAATTAVVVMSVAIYVANRSHSPASQTSQASKTVPPPSPRETFTANSGATPETGTAPTVTEQKQIERRVRKPPRHVEAHRWPSQFPTPAPLTPEEKALVQYVQETPPEVLAASFFPQLLESQPTEINPVKIPPIKIQPLTVRTPGEELQ